MIRILALLAAAAALFASDGSLELRGAVTGAGDTGALRVQLFGVETPYTASMAVGARGEFRFRGLAPGNYTIAVVHRGLGEIRRTVAIRAALADSRGDPLHAVRSCPERRSRHGDAASAVGSRRGSLEI